MYIMRFEVTHSPFHCLKLLFPFNICVSKSLIFSFAVSYLPLIPPSVSLISGIIVLISKSCSLGLFIFFVSLLSLLNPWNTVIMKVLMSFLLSSVSILGLFQSTNFSPHCKLHFFTSCKSGNHCIPDVWILDIFVFLYLFLSFVLGAVKLVGKNLKLSGLTFKVC